MSKTNQSKTRLKFQPGDALLIVDPQIDFLPGGALGVPDGDTILPIINNWIVAAEEANIPVIVTRDWHPPHHISFKEQGGPWPPHCVRNTPGANYPSELKLPANTIIVNKATDPIKEDYSAMGGVTVVEGITLPKKLKQLNIKRLWLAGLTFDFCVKYTSLDARHMGLSVHVIIPACRAITVETEQDAFRKMAAAGVILETDSDPYFEK